MDALRSVRGLCRVSGSFWDSRTSWKRTRVVSGVGWSILIEALSGSGEATRGEISRVEGGREGRFGSGGSSGSRGSFGSVNIQVELLLLNIKYVLISFMSQTIIFLKY